jgi:hypothetical protein
VFTNFLSRGTEESYDAGPWSPNRKFRIKFEGTSLKIDRKARKLMLSITGATIILATFYVNDTKRDNLKDFKDSIENAENLFITMLATDHTFQELVDFRHQFDQFVKDPTHPLVEKDTLNEERVHEDEFNDGFIAITTGNRLLKMVGRLLEKLHDTGPNKNTFDDLTKERQTLWDEYLSLKKIVETKSFDRAGKQEQLGEQKTEELNLRIASFFGKSTALNVNAEDLASDIFNEADQVRKDAEQQYGRWTLAFNILYGFGWVLGVTGLALEGGEPEKVVEQMSEV